MIDFLVENKTALQLVHLLGILIAISGTILAESSFLKSVEDSFITPLELRKIKISGRIVIFGLLVIILSGLSIFLSNVDLYAHSAKFLAKMTIVGVLTANGLLLHLRHIPWLSRSVGTNLRVLPDYGRRSVELVLSGALSSSSWGCAFMLGAFRYLPYSYTVIISFYGGVVVLSLAISLLLRKYLV